MAKSGWCLEGRHAGTNPQFSKPCPGGKCSCECHTPREPRFKRRKKADSE